MVSTTTFLIMFVAFAGILVGLGVYSKRWVRESSDFILAGREVSLLINIMGVCAMGFAGTTIALAPGFAVLMGLKGSLAWGLAYSLCGIVLFGLLFGKFIRRCGAQTLPEYLEMRFDGRVRSVISITSVIGLSGILANNIVSCAQVIAGYTGWPNAILVSVIFVIILGFTYISGLWAATITDLFQVSIGLVGVPVLLYLLIKKYGGLEYLSQHWPSGDWVNAGMAGAQIPVGALTYPSILNFVICFAAALVWGSNYYWMKAASCRSEKISRDSYIIAGLVLAGVFMIPLAYVGIYAGASHTDLFAISGGTLGHTAAYGIIVKIFPPLLGSFFVIAAVAASISSAATNAIGATAVASRDIYQRLINPAADTKLMLKVSKRAMILIGVITWVMCQFPGGPIYLFAFANCWLVPPALLLGLGVIWPRFNNRGAICGALAGMTVMVVFTILGDILGVFIIGKYIYPASLGFIVTLAVSIITTYTKEPKYFGRSDWSLTPNSSNRISVNLTEFEKDLLAQIRVGHRYMSDLTDAAGVDSKTSGEAIERLDQGGYLSREGVRGSAFYTFNITDKGLAALSELAPREAEMASVGLTPMYLELLDIVKNHPDRQADFITRYNIKSMHMAAISTHLTRQGYVREQGMFKRKLAITEKGTQALEKFK